MNITLKPASENQSIYLKDTDLNTLVETFINGDLQDAIVSRKNNPREGITPFSGPFKGCKVYCVNVNVPIKAYQNLGLFYKLCIDTLDPLGYHAERGCDGGGMHSTLYVTWKSQ